MTKKEMENAIRNLQSAVSALAAKTYSRNSDTEDDIAKVNGDIAEVDAKADETAVTTALNEETLAYIITDALPEQAVRNDDMSSTIEYILTEVIPSLMGGE